MKARNIKTHLKHTRKYCKNDQPAGKRLHINILHCMLHHVNLRTAKKRFRTYRSFNRTCATIVYKLQHIYAFTFSCIIQQEEIIVLSAPRIGGIYAFMYGSHNKETTGWRQFECMHSRSNELMESAHFHTDIWDK